MSSNEAPPKVFVMQEQPNRNFLPAQQFGEIVFLSSQEPTQGDNSLYNAEIFQNIVAGMRDYRPGIDYLIPSGSPMTISMCMLVAGWKGGKIRMLSWHNREYRYYEYMFDLDWLLKETSVTPSSAFRR